MPNKSIFDRPETSSHCRRVCALARRTSEILNLGDDVESALGVAASLHHVSGGRSLEGTFDNFPGISSDTVSLAGRILRRVSSDLPSGSDTVEVSADILNICNEFDEAVEFAALEGASLADAIAEFHRENPVDGARHTLEALREATVAPLFRLPDGALPVMPKASARLLRTSDETSPAALESIVATDQVLAGRLLEVANSGLLGGPQRITHLLDGIARVGVPRARKVLFAASVGIVFGSSSLRRLWDKLQRIANVVSAAASQAGLDAEDAYVTGLLHDIGCLVFESGPAHARVALAHWLSSGFSLPYAEVLTYSMDHAAAGAELLRDWGLPEAVLEAVECHHAPERSTSPMASLLFLAEQWHTEAFAPDSGRDLLQSMRRAYAARLTGISVRDLAAADEQSYAFRTAC